jgi:hypothetical protein
LRAISLVEELLEIHWVVKPLQSLNLDIMQWHDYLGWVCPHGLPSITMAIIFLAILVLDRIPLAQVALGLFLPLLGESQYRGLPFRGFNR